VSRDHVTIVELYSKQCVWQGLDDRAFHFNVFFFRHYLPLTPIAVYHMSYPHDFGGV
jgi:hypothetical protein